MKKYLLLCFIMSYAFAKAQQIEPLITKNAYQLELRHDNDFLLTTDRYYSSGLFLKYRQTLKKGLLRNTKWKEQLQLALGQEIYTPSQVESIDVNELDRPYAGYISLGGSWSAASKNQLFKIGLETGLTGPQSGVESFHKWYHKNIVPAASTPTWVAQIANQLHFNVEVSYVREWLVTPNPFSITFAVAPKAVLGSKDVYVQPDVLLYFGRRGLTNVSSAYSQIGDLKREIFFALRAGYRWVGANALIEGESTTEFPPLAIATKDFFIAAFDFSHRYGSSDYKVSFVANGKETLRSSSHSFIRLSYGYTF